jgi:hypothetical protein
VGPESRFADRDYYVSEDADSKKKREKYYLLMLLKCLDFQKTEAKVHAENSSA